MPDICRLGDRSTVSSTINGMVLRRGDGLERIGTVTESSKDFEPKCNFPACLCRCLGNGGASVSDCQAIPSIR